jgi:large subunit ribosomal protein L15e
MGALKYVEELQKKKQSDVLRFLLRVRCWEVSQLHRLFLGLVAPYLDIYHYGCLSTDHSKRSDFSFANSTSSIELLVHRDRIRLVVSDTRRSKVMSSTGCVFAEEAGKDPCQRGLLMVCPKDCCRESSAKTQFTLGKPTNQGVNQLKYQRSLKSTAEGRVGRRCANLRVLNSYWINQDSTYKYFEVILVDPQHKAIRRDPRINWIVKPVHKVGVQCYGS